MSFDDADDVAPARSPRSTSRTERPRPAASRAIPTPLIPPPTTSRSTGGTAPSPAATLVVDILSNRHLLPVGRTYPPLWFNSIPRQTCRVRHTHRRLISVTFHFGTPEPVRSQT